MDNQQSPVQWRVRIVSHFGNQALRAR
uniref:Uncharacterized protein n=1 Tax=mine drainage metagenome TaxID=410659 RepID=E6QIE0_9ZZZZ